MSSSRPSTLRRTLHHDPSPPKSPCNPLISLPSAVTDAINPAPWRRLLIALTFPLVFLVAIPYWWYNTSIERLVLPAARIAALERSQPPVIRSPILFTADDDAFPVPPPGKARFEKSVILESIAKEVTKGVDGILNQQRPLERGRRTWDLVVTHEHNTPPVLRAHLRTWQYANTSFPLEPYIQASEAGLMTSGIPPGTLVVPVHPKQLGDRHLNRHYQIALIKSFIALHPNHYAIPEIPLRALSYKPNITLSFVLLNEDSSEGSYVRTWDIEDALQDHILPHLEPLTPIFNFSIESQVLYHAPLTFSPALRSVPPGDDEMVQPAIEAAKAGDEQAAMIAQQILEGKRRQAFVVSEEDLKVFVNSERWSLDSGSTNNPVLRFLLFVPAKRHRPMHLALPDTADAFVLPQYGAVAILNPPPSSQTSAYHLPRAVMAPSFHLFTQHLYSLLALPTIPAYIHPSPPPSPMHPPLQFTQCITPWQIDQIMRVRAAENSAEARKTLAGIIRLVRKIKEMKVGDGVRGKVLLAVEKLEQMDQTTETSQAFSLARDAVDLANQAFFDPSMMGLLYFPDEHKFAVYTPLFAPIAVPVLIGLLKELVAWRRRRKAVQSLPVELTGPVSQGESADIGIIQQASQEPTAVSRGSD